MLDSLGQGSGFPAWAVDVDVFRPLSLSASKAALFGNMVLP